MPNRTVRTPSWATSVALAAAFASACDSPPPIVEPSVSHVAEIRPASPVELTGVVGTDVTPTPTVQVLDQNGQPLAGVLIRFTVGIGAGSILHTSVLSDAAGLANVGRWTLGVKPERQILAVSAVGFAPVVFSVTPAPGPVSVFYAGNDRQRGFVSSPLPWPLYVRLADAYENPIRGAAVTIVVSSGGGKIDVDAAITNLYGEARLGYWTLGPELGTQEVTAHAGGVQRVFQAVAEAPPPPCATAPDCGRIAFVSDRGGNADIYSVNWDGTGLTPLTTHLARDEDPAWSPDSRRIAFTSTRSGQGPDIYTMNADGSDVVRRTFTGRSADPAWSPDGATIVYSTSRSNGVGCLDWSGDIWEVGAEVTGPAHRLVFSAGVESQAREPAWSPDGARIAFALQRVDFFEAAASCDDWYVRSSPLDVFLVDRDGSAVTALTRASNGVAYSGPAWSPAGTEIVVAVHEYEEMSFDRIAVMRSDGSDMRLLGHGGGWVENVTWSPDGNLIAYDGSGVISWIRADGSDSGMIAYGSDPDWQR